MIVITNIKQFFKERKNSIFLKDKNNSKRTDTFYCNDNCNSLKKFNQVTEPAPSNEIN